MQVDCSRHHCFKTLWTRACPGDDAWRSPAERCGRSATMTPYPPGIPHFRPSGIESRYRHNTNCWYSFSLFSAVHFKTILSKTARVAGWTFFGLFVVLITAILLVRVPSVQNRIAQKAISWLEEKIKTRVELERIVINFPKTIVIEGLFLQDQQQDTLIYAGRISVDASMMDLFRRGITLNSVGISNTTGAIARNRNDSTFNFSYIVDAFASADSTAADTTSAPWTFSIGDIVLDDVRFRYGDEVDPMTLHASVGNLDIDTDQIDIETLAIALDDITIADTRIRFETDSLQLDVSGLALSASGVKYDSTNIEADISSFAAKENIRGFALAQLSGFVRMQGDVVELKNVDVRYGQSTIHLTGKGNYRLREGEVMLTETTIAVSDLLSLQPHLLDSLPVHIPPNSIVRLDLDARGNLDNATIDKLIVQTFDSTYLSAKGTTQDIDIQFHTSANDINTVLPDTLLPVTPKWVSLSGNVKGGLQKKQIIQAKLATDLGTIDTNAELQLPVYKASIQATAIRAGKIAGQSALGDVTFDLRIDGSGLTMDDLHTRIDLLVKEFSYNNYAYRDFAINGTIDKFFFSGQAMLDDENLAFELNADLDYNGDIPLYKAQFDLRNIDLQGLQLSERPLKARLTVDVDLATSDFQVMNGRMDIRKAAVFNGDQLYAVDSLLVASLDQEGRSELTVRSDLLDGNFEGSFNIFGLAKVLEDHFERYFGSGVKNAVPSGPPQHFSFDLKLRNTDLITEVLVPALEPFTPGVIRGAFDSRAHELNVEFRMPKMQYNTIAVDSLVLLVDSDADELRYSARIDNIVADTIRVEQVKLSGLVADDTIASTLSVLDSLQEQKYRVGARIARDTDLMRIQLDDSLMLNYGVWSVPSDNFLSIGPDVLAARNFGINKQNQQIMFAGDTRHDPAMTVTFKELELSNLTRIISGLVPASGELNGDFKFTTSGSSNFSSRLTISGLTIMHVPVGDLTLAMSHAQTDYNVQLNLRGNRTSVETSGTYGGPKGQETLDLQTNITQLNMEVVQAFSMGQLTNAEGSLKGSIAIKGKPSDPDISGNLVFADVSAVSPYLNSKFTLKDERIGISNDKISFNKFTIADVAGNQATLTGAVDITNFSNLSFDLSLDTRAFQVLDTKEGDNDLYFGRVKINSTARITGSSRQPKVDVKLGFTEDTNLTYIVPASEKTVLEAKGIVNFVDKDAAGDAFLADLDASDSVHSTFTGIDVNAVIDLTDSEALNLIVDPITGDKLTVQGNGSLTFDMTASGNMNLSGRYEITSGSYNLSFYNLVKKRFDIVEGSNITWSGDPLSAQLDIRASNLVETSPLELVSNQVSSDDPAANNFNQRLPFLVYLNIKGRLLAPQISFALDMPADKRYAFGGMLYSKIQDINTRESDLNKQVFGLLILKRFVSDNPLESNAGSTNAARTSVSRMLSEQLNRLSSNIKGVQLTADIKSYEDVDAEGAQATTKAQLGVSKSLFGDRLIVKLSGNVDIEGEEAGSANATDYIGDLALEYKMTPDGRFRVTGFRNSNYDMIDGELTETGAGLIYIKDYNTLRELFKANEKLSP